MRWNEDRALAAVDGASSQPRGTYNSALRHGINRLSTLVYGQVFDNIYQDPGTYTGKMSSVSQLCMLTIFFSFFLCRSKSSQELINLIF